VNSGIAALIGCRAGTFLSVITVIPTRVCLTRFGPPASQFRITVENLDRPKPRPNFGYHRFFNCATLSIDEASLRKFLINVWGSSGISLQIASRRATDEQACRAASDPLPALAQRRPGDWAGFRNRRVAITGPRRWPPGAPRFGEVTDRVRCHPATENPARSTLQIANADRRSAGHRRKTSGPDVDARNCCHRRSSKPTTWPQEFGPVRWSRFRLQDLGIAT